MKSLILFLFRKLPYTLQIGIFTFLLGIPYSLFLGLVFRISSNTIVQSILFANPVGIIIGISIGTIFMKLNNWRKKK